MMEENDDCIEVKLSRGASGDQKASLGMTIKGGVDERIFEQDTSIYISRILDGGLAASSGQLSPGDRILKVNNKEMKDVLHREAVKAFLDSRDQVILLVQKGAEEKMQQRLNETEAESPMAEKKESVILPLTFAALIAGAAIWYFYFRRQNS